MKLFEDLPYLALRRIVLELSIGDRFNLSIACQKNEYLSTQLNFIASRKRPKFCAFCILYVNTDYTCESSEKEIHDLHNQILKQKDGDLNWDWNYKEAIYTLTMNDRYEGIGFHAHGFRWNKDIIALLHWPDKYQIDLRKDLLSGIQSIYSIDNSDLSGYATDYELLRHINSAHGNLFRNASIWISDLDSLENILNNTCLEDIPIFHLPTGSDSVAQNQILSFIHVHVACSYHLLINLFENVVKMPTKNESPQVYLNTHIKLILGLTDQILLKMKIFANRAWIQDRLNFIRKIMKLNYVLEIIFQYLD